MTLVRHVADPGPPNDAKNEAKIQVENLAFSGSSARYESKWNQKRSGAWSTGPGLLFLTPLEKTRLRMCHAMVRGLNF